MIATAKKAGLRLWVYGTAALLTTICGFPLAWLILTSIKPDREIFAAVTTFWTDRPSLDAYARLFEETN